MHAFAWRQALSPGIRVLLQARFHRGQPLLHSGVQVHLHRLPVENLFDPGVRLVIPSFVGLGRAPGIVRVVDVPFHMFECVVRGKKAGGGMAVLFDHIHRHADLIRRVDATGDVLDLSHQIVQEDQMLVAQHQQ